MRRSLVGYQQLHPEHGMYSSSTSAEVFQPSVFRGLEFSALATAWISRAFHRDKSVPFGKYCRNRPFVFSFVPRCLGLRGSAKSTFTLDSTVKRTRSESSLPRSQVNDCHKRVDFRDEQWREKLLELFQIATRPSEFEDPSTVFDERAKLVLSAAKEFLTEQGPPRKIDARRIAQKVGLSHETVSAIVKRTPELISIFQTSRDSFSIRRMVWTLKKIMATGEQVNPTTISNALSVNYYIDQNIYREMQEISRSNVMDQSEL